MRHVQITHTYVLPVPDEAVDTLDATVSRGIQMMEEKILRQASNAEDIRSHWQLMPKSYTREHLAANDPLARPAPVTGSRITRLASPDDPAPIPHPWDEGAWIFPNDHPPAPLERAAKAQTEDPNPSRRPDVALIREAWSPGSPLIKELTSGD